MRLLFLLLFSVYGFKAMMVPDFAKFRNDSITSENYPANYHDNTQEWSTVNVYPPSDKYVLFQLEKVDTYIGGMNDHQSMCNDNVTIYYNAAENDIETLCTGKNLMGQKTLFGNGRAIDVSPKGIFHNHTIEPNQSNFSVLFVSDLYGNAGGFKINYAIYFGDSQAPAPEEAAPTPTTSHGMNTIDLLKTTPYSSEPEPEGGGIAGAQKGSAAAKQAYIPAILVAAALFMFL